MMTTCRRHQEVPDHLEIRKKERNHTRNQKNQAASGARSPKKNKISKVILHIAETDPI
jgi:hypothetical protein